VLYLGYFSNFLLIAIFLGIGLGFLLSRRNFDLFRFVPQAILFLVAFMLITRIDVTVLREKMGQLFFGHGGSLLKLPLWVSLPLLFTSTAFIFAGIAQETGRCFSAYRPLVAYSLDIGGSLAGIVFFTLHSYLGGSPLQWMILAFAAIVLLSRRYSLFNAGAMGLAVVLLIVAKAPDHYVRWSPYQRIDVWPMTLPGGKVGYHLSANGIGHQTMQPVGTKEPIYDFPYREVLQQRGGKKYGRALVIGSGGGTDVSYALHYGVERIDAVEIDPEIYRAGWKFHPAVPYRNPRVTAYVNDGRAFMERTSNRYDLVVYALPDSVASLSNFANIRLESFLFTLESFKRAKSLLTEDGTLVLYNYYRKSWLAEKLADMLTEVFGRHPLKRVYSDERGGYLSALAVGPTVSGTPRPGPKHPPARDEWPFLYMQRPHIPVMYAWIIFLFIGVGLFGVVATGQATWSATRVKMPFLLMGAAFLLLETKSVIQFSLLFGATWLVNSLVFAAILASVLLANLVASRLRNVNFALVFALLLAALLVQIFLPLERLLGIESLPLRYTVASLIFFAPVFLANLLFSVLFRDTEESASAFGWNVIGTTIGGALEYTSMAIGYQTLTVAVAVLYSACVAWIYLAARRRGAPSLAAERSDAGGA
jgi:hypothetical protein